MPGNGNGREARFPRFEDVPWEEVRSIVWELRRCRELCFGENSALAVRVVDGEKFIEGFSEAKLMVAIDLAKMVERLWEEIGHQRQERFLDWMSGVHPQKFGRVEQVQLKDDVCRLAELTIAGGYRFMLNPDGDKK